MTDNAPYTLRLGTIVSSVEDSHFTFVDGMPHRITGSEGSEHTVKLTFTNGTQLQGDVSEHWDFVVPYGNVVQSIDVSPINALASEVGGVAIKVTHVSGVGELTSGPDKGKPCHFSHDIGEVTFFVETNTSFPQAEPCFSNSLGNSNRTYEMMMHPISDDGSLGNEFLISSSTTNLAGYARNFWQITGTTFERVSDPGTATRFQTEGDLIYHVTDTGAKSYLGLDTYPAEPKLRRIVWVDQPRAISVMRPSVPHNRFG